MACISRSISLRLCKSLLRTSVPVLFILSLEFSNSMQLSELYLMLKESQYLSSLFLKEFMEVLWTVSALQ